MGNNTSRRGRTSKGSVFIETALIFIVFAGMLIGAFDFGQFLFIHQALVERARYAARWGAINDPTDSASITNMVLYYQATTPPSGTPYFNLTASNVTVTNPDSGTDNYRLNIQISGYSYTILSPYIGGNYTGPPVTVSVPLGLYN
jgi:Flp pilus assembly protein TadG